MPKKHDLPAMPFYVGDWLKCPEVRSLAPDIRGLWFDLICYMWESTERGVMIYPSGKPYTKNDIIRLIGLDNQNSESWLTLLIDTGVCGVRPTDQAIYCRRMVKDEIIRQTRREIGKRGGNPILLVNHIDNYQDKLNTEDENEDENTLSSSIIKNVINTTGDRIVKERGKFMPPSLKDLQDYCISRKNTINAKQFMSYYESKGWMIGCNKMKDWKAAVRTWEIREKETQKLKPTETQRKNFASMERLMNQKDE